MPTHNPIIINRTNYCLMHLEDIFFSTVEHGEIFTVKIIFSPHCYSIGEKYANNSHTYVVADPKDTRYFDIDRYNLSKNLPKFLLENFLSLKIFATRNNNFVRINLINGEPYYIFLRCRYENKTYIINIESAYKDTINNPPKYDKKNVRKIITLLKQIK